MSHMAETIRIDRDTWRLEDGTVRMFLLCGTERALLIDSGMNTPDIRTEVEKLTDLPLSLLNTHADPDHISGNSAFEEVYMSPEEERDYRAFGGTCAVVPVKEGDVIDLGGRPLRIIDIPGHTPGSIAVLDEKNRVLISGDSVQDGFIFMFTERRDMAVYAESMEHLSEYDGQYDVVYPSHGTFPVSPELVGKLREGARAVLSGEAQGEPTEVFGNRVCLYKFPYAGFLCDLRE